MLCLMVLQSVYECKDDVQSCTNTALELERKI